MQAPQKALILAKPNGISDKNMDLPFLGIKWVLNFSSRYPKKLIKIVL